MPECKMDKVGFHNHMENKCDQWGPEHAFFGDDFVVFQFEYAYKAKEAENNMKHYCSYYGYRCNRGDKSLVIINTSGDDG